MLPIPIPEDKMINPRDLRIKLAEHDLNGKEFAQLVGVSQQHMSAILRGNKTRRVVRIRIAEVLDALDRHGPPPPQPEGVEPRVRRM